MLVALTMMSTMVRSMTPIMTVMDKSMRITLMETMTMLMVKQTKIGGVEIPNLKHCLFRI